MERNMTGTELAMLSQDSVRAAALDTAKAVSALSWMPRIEEHPSWKTFAQLRVTMRAGVTLNHFKVLHLLSLKEGQVFESVSPDTEDVPLMVGKVQLGWSEFEIVDQRMALRLTRLG
jgi:hypothetical protein